MLWWICPRAQGDELYGADSNNADRVLENDAQAWRRKNLWNSSKVGHIIDERMEYHRWKISTKISGEKAGSNRSHKRSQIK